MTNPQIQEEEPISLAEAKNIIKSIEKRDTELNYRSNRANEVFEHFSNILSVAKKDELVKKLEDLNLTRLKKEHMIKITDFLPVTINDLKVVLQAYPLSMPKKDQEAIIKVVKEFK